MLSAAVVESSDDGATWSKPRLITDVVKPGDSAVPGAVRSTFATSGQGIQITRGQYAGRLVQQYAGDVMQSDGSRVIQAFSVYSDDHGATWQRGEFTGSAMDENKVVELSDGRLLLNSRDNAGGGYRKVEISNDGGHSYSAVTQDKNLPNPTNNAHITQMFPEAAANSAQARKLLYTGADSQTARANVSARVSCDDGKTWPGLRTIRRGFSAYSVADTLDNGKFGVFYEGNYTDSMQFATFDESWLNYVCAPMEASSFTADPATTIELPVTITNQEAQAISGSVSVGTST
ncbi:sialidase family protein [Glutamicibacter mishrai]|uniref:sialidase family protein n=1 Tax=Glutamicibacter mishrai TaxID=1775880 RepID=UPI0032EF303C